MIRRVFSRLTCRQFEQGKSVARLRNRRRTGFDWNTLEQRRLLAADDGWVGSYYLAGAPDPSPDQVQHDALINFDWGQKSPLDNANDSDGFSARWESNLQSDHTATHQLIFRMNPNDGLRVWVDNQVVVDAWGGAGSEELLADVPLVADESKSVRIEYRDIAGQARLWVGWTSPELPKEVVGPEWTPLTAAQINTLDEVSPRGMLFEQLSSVGTDFLDNGDVSYDDVADGSRIAGTSVASDSTTHPAQRARGYVVPETSGVYQFRISGGDANRLLLADDATPELARLIASTSSPSLPNQWTVDSDQTSPAIALVAGVKYYFEARQTATGDYDGLEIQWRKPNSAWESIPNEVLRPIEAEVGVRAVVSAVNETDDSTTLSFDVSRSDDFGRDLPVQLSYGGTAARDVDYSGAVSTATIPAGQRSVRVDLLVANDGVDELLETIKVGVADSNDYELTSPVRTRTTLSIFGNLIPTAGSSLIANDPLAVSNISQTGGSTYSSFSNRTANGENGGTINGTVLVVDTTTQPPNSSSIWARWDVAQNIDESETLYAEFYYRRIGTSWSQLEFNVRTTSPSNDFGTTAVTAKGFWQRAQIPIRLSDSIDSATAQVELFLGSKVAKVEIANFQVKRFVESIDNAVAGLPADAGSLADLDITAGRNTFATFTDRTTAAAEQVPFNNALTIDVHTAASFLSQIRAGWYSDIAIQENSVLTAEVWLRTDDSPFDVRLQIEQSPAVNRNLLRKDLVATNQWTKHQFQLTARQSSEAGELRFEAAFGRSVGVLEIGGIQIWNQGAVPDLTQHLPQGNQNYSERDAGSDWRWDAQQAVLENRRSELLVNVTNLAGAPILGATVNIDQIEHSYGFGNILKTEFISDIAGGQASDPASQRHAAIASRLFNTITIANGIRWNPWAQSRARGIDTVNWVNDNVDSLHGHHLTWGQLSMIPSAVRNEYNRLNSEVSASAAREYLRTAQLEHVADIANELSGTIDGTSNPKIAHWDTVNHPVLIKELWNILRNGGPISDPIGEVFDVAKANSHPDTLQMVNEGQTIERVGIPRRTEYYNLIADLLADGKPVEAVGFMNHFDLDVSPSPTQFDAYLDEFAALGLPLGMTEFDIDSTGTDLQTQADWSEDYYLNVFANPATEFIIGYGFYQLAHWRHDVGAHWYTSDWEAKPNGEVFVDQVHREWQTNTFGSTRADGTYRTMAFDGRQQVTVTVDGQTYQAIVDVDSNGSIANIMIDRPTVVDAGTRIEAENYDGGGEGVAYHDTTAGNAGEDFRASENVDVGANSDGGEPGYNLGWIRDGEWLQYTADIVGGQYDISARVASNNASPGSLRILVSDGTSFSELGTISVDSTGGWSNWTTLSLNNIDLTDFAGTDQVLRLEMVGGNFNLNWFEFNQSASVEGRYVFYNDSHFDGNDVGTNANDDAAKATDKTALLPGQTATFANYTSFSNGINGVFIDIQGIGNANMLSASDFILATGNGSLASDFTTFGGSFNVSVRAGDGELGSDRIALTLANGTILNTWLQVTVRATASTGLAIDDVFYFGNAVAETGGTDAAVNSEDVLATRANRTGPFNPPPVDNRYDFDRSGAVDSVDVLIARRNRTNPFNQLNLIVAPNAGGSSLVGFSDDGSDRGTGVSGTLGRHFSSLPWSTRSGLGPELDEMRTRKIQRGFVVTVLERESSLAAQSTISNERQLIRREILLPRVSSDSDAKDDLLANPTAPAESASAIAFTRLTQHDAQSVVAAKPESALQMPLVFEGKESASTADSTFEDHDSLDSIFVSLDADLLDTV